VIRCDYHKNEKELFPKSWRWPLANDIGRMNEKRPFQRKGRLFCYYAQSHQISKDPLWSLGSIKKNSRSNPLAAILMSSSEKPLWNYITLQIWRPCTSCCKRIWIILLLRSPLRKFRGASYQFGSSDTDNALRSFGFNSELGFPD
jgi:hypothetical protein